MDKTSIFYITINGFTLAKRLNTLYPDAQILRFSRKAVSEVWMQSKRLIFIMATGIVVRTIAPFIRDKKTDPAVVVLDETGKYVISLISGHLGGANELSKEIASFLKGEAVITTSTDVNNLIAIDIWASENNLKIEDTKILPHVVTRYINNGALRIYSEIELPLPDEFLKVGDPRFADVIVTNKRDIYHKNPHDTINECSTTQCRQRSQLYLRPKNLVVGIGCNSGTSDEEIENAVRLVFEDNNLSFLSICYLTTIDIKCKERGLVNFAKRHGFEIIGFKAQELNSVDGIERSEAVFKATGANAVCEPSALLGSGASELLVPKRRLGNVTIAVAELVIPNHINSKTPSLYIVGTGPGSIEHITSCAQDAIRRSDVIVGYKTYLDLIPQLIKDKEIISTSMTEEIERCKKAIELSMTGKTVSLISGGDPGIYAMAGLVFEILKNREPEGIDQKVRIEVIPGISALNACAARLGAPLMHDFAVVSLSDRLTPWELIEKRLIAVAMSDFVVVLYNPRSIGRPEHINMARDIFLRHRSTETPVGIVKSAMREDERIIITNLRDMLNYDIDMQTTVIIGNSQTYTWRNRMITPRGYEKKPEFKDS